MKYIMRSNPQSQPAPIATVPATHAASAPEPVSHRNRHAVSAITAARAIPIVHVWMPNTPQG
jgi:hypothetical protein